LTSTTTILSTQPRRDNRSIKIALTTRRRSSSQLKMSGTSSTSSKWIVSSLYTDESDDTATATATATEETTPRTPTHLFLHFDINETILLGDDAGGDSRHESTQKMLAKSSFCRMPDMVINDNDDDNDDDNDNDDDDNDNDEHEHHQRRRWENTQQLKPTHWWDGQEIGKERSIPPLYTGWKWPDGCCPYYRTAYKNQAKSFVDNHPIFLPILEACETAISVNKGKGELSSSTLSPSSSSQKSSKQDRKDTILPAFYETLRHLIDTTSSPSYIENVDGTNKKPPFTVIFRTFGSDLAEIASVVTTFAKGKHPEYPSINFSPLCLSEDRLFQGRWKVIHDDKSNTKKPIYQLWKYHDESQLVASGDAEILDLFKEGSVFGIRDDYNYWKSNQWNPTAGKPIWVRNYDESKSNNNKHDENNNVEKETEKDHNITSIDHHILFDDNIHNLHNDGIACVRKELPQDDDDENSGAVSFDTVDGANIDSYHGVNLIRVPTVEPVLDPHWYIQQIEMARNRFQCRLR
jgi:hypothetical protein